MSIILSWIASKDATPILANWVLTSALTLLLKDTFGASLLQNTIVPTTLGDRAPESLAM